MLRVSHADTSDGQRWNTDGSPAGPWVELHRFWQQAQERAPRPHAVANLKDLTVIDEAGEDLLADMYGAGAEFVAAGVENKHILANLKEKGKCALQSGSVAAMKIPLFRARRMWAELKAVWKNADTRRAPAVANCRSKDVR